jgi:tRNA threonylcarbamoyladenosine biosynthesis protein TsaE
MKEAVASAAGEISSFRLVSEDPLETFRMGRILGQGLQGGDVVALTGELGAGKTCLTQGIADGLGVPAGFAVTSPTFTLINEYPGKETSLYHLDVYRLVGTEDLQETGYEECLLGGGVLVIEWAEKIREAVPDEALFIRISWMDENLRKIEISGRPDRIGFWRRKMKEGGFA